MKNNFLATIIILVIVLIAYMHQAASAAPAISGDFQHRIVWLAKP